MSSLLPRLVGCPDGWYWISPGVGGDAPTIAKELVPGAFAQVTWTEVFVATYNSGDQSVTRFWRAVPPTSDYVALGFVAMSGSSASAIPSQPSDSLAGRFRAVHKRALTGASTGVTEVFSNDDNPSQTLFSVDNHYWLADIGTPHKEDLYVLDPKSTIQEWS
jgi:hypothetical protein